MGKLCRRDDHLGEGPVWAEGAKSIAPWSDRDDLAELLIAVLDIHIVK